MHKTVTLHPPLTPKSLINSTLLSVSMYLTIQVLHISKTYNIRPFESGLFHLA